MSQFTTKASWLSLLVALLAVSTVHAHPIHRRNEQVDGQAGKQSRSPRLIPDTEKYINDVFKELGLTEPTPTPTPTPTSMPTSTLEAEHGQPETTQVSPTTQVIYSSSTSYTPTSSSNQAGYTHTLEGQVANDKPIENVQSMQGWSKDRKLTAEDLPIVFDAFYRELRHRISNTINSSDEIGLDRFLE